MPRDKSVTVNLSATVSPPSGVDRHGYPFPAGVARYTTIDAAKQWGAGVNGNLSDLRQSSVVQFLCPVRGEDTFIGRVGVLVDHELPRDEYFIDARAKGGLAAKNWHTKTAPNGMAYTHNVFAEALILAVIEGPASRALPDVEAWLDQC